MEIYFIKSAACLALLLLFYKLLLENENMHMLKRFYLLAAPIFSFVIPAITFTEYVVFSPEGSLNFIETTSASKASVFSILKTILSGIYIIGVLFFGSKFLFNLRSLLQKVKVNPTIKTPGSTKVLLQEEVSPHTFWKYIFFNRQKYEAHQIPREVLDHELVHVKQRHSADIIFVEILQILLWFYPLIYLLRNAIKLNHEFLADRSVLENSKNTAAYQNILLSFSSGGYNNNLVNSINYQSIKKRFTVMKKKTSSQILWFKSFLLLPLLAILLYSFSTKEVVLQNPAGESEVNQEKATPKMIAEYNKLAKYYGEKQINEAIVQEKGFKRMLYIYGIMTEGQRKDAEKLPPPPPPARITREVPPPPAPPIVNAADAPPPPPPPSPIEAVQGWVEEGAEFFYNGKSISSKEVLEMVQKNNGKNLSVQVQERNSKKTVRLSDKKW